MEKNIFVRLFKIISILIIVAAVIFVALIWIKGDSAMTENLGLQNSVLNPFFLVAYIALALCILMALLFPIFNIISNPKVLVKSLIGLAVIVAVGFLIYSMSSNELTKLQLMDYKITETTSRQVGAALYGTYLIGALSVLAILYAELSSFFKK